MDPAIVIVGATSSIAEHCARLWVGRGARRLVLVGRDAGRTERIARDLRVRAPEARIDVDIVDDFTSVAAIREAVARIGATGPVGQVLIAHGSLPDQALCQSDLAEADQALRINALSPALWAEAFVGLLASRGGGVVAVIGSVAGDRGRRKNYTYGAAKALLARYVEGLQHRFPDGPVHCVMVKPGPTDTPMAAHLRARGAKLADVATVARDIVDGMAARRRVVYTPGRWALVMLVFRHIPWLVFRRLDV